MNRFRKWILQHQIKKSSKSARKAIDDYLHSPAFVGIDPGAKPAMAVLGRRADGIIIDEQIPEMDFALDDSIMKKLSNMQWFTSGVTTDTPDFSHEILAQPELPKLEWTMPPYSNRILENHKRGRVKWETRHYRIDPPGLLELEWNIIHKIFTEEMFDRARNEIGRQIETTNAIWEQFKHRIKLVEKMPSPEQVGKKVQEIHYVFSILGDPTSKP